MVHGGRRAGLSDEPGPERRVRGESWRENLERDQPVEALVARPVYDGHAALPDLPFQTVAGDLISGADVGSRRRDVVAHRTPLTEADRPEPQIEHPIPAIDGDLAAARIL